MTTKLWQITLVKKAQNSLRVFWPSVLVLFTDRNTNCV